MSKPWSEVLQKSVQRLDDIGAGRVPRPPVFDPPYDSPLEKDFAWHLTKYLDQEVVVVKQFNADSYRIDFMLRAYGRTIGVECDGKAYHLNEARDAERDSRILASGAVQAMYRLRGQDVFWHTQDVLYLLGQREPWMFSERGLRNLEVQATESAKQYLEADDQIIVHYQDEDTGQTFDLKIVVRRP